jgi:ribosomal protein S18 acetylase RimI-like enzyme
MLQAIQLKPIQATEFEELFAKYKAALITVIEDTFGWDEGFQRERFRTRFDLSWFNWVDIGDRRVGYICYWEKASEIHISLLIIDAKERGLGFGRKAMAYLHAEAHKRNCRVTLSSFRKNVEAIKFYEGLGYVAAGGDEHFLDMILNVP